MRHCRVFKNITDVLKEFTASIFKLKEYAKQAKRAYKAGL
jgi:hypothetical protein